MMLVALVGALALLATSSDAQLSFNSSSIITTHNITAILGRPNSTITAFPSLSTISTDQTKGSNATKNACQAKFESWTNDYWGWRPEITYVTTFTEVYDRTLSSTEIFDCTRTCGTICYAGPVTTVKLTTHISTVYSRTYGRAIPFTTPRPNCTIEFDDCLSLQSSYTSATSSISALPLEEMVTIPDPIPPACSACVSTACTFAGMGGMSLYFWPVTTSVSRDYCATEPAGGPATAFVPDVNHTYVPITTGPYAVVNDITMYQGNVYASFYHPVVFDNCGNNVPRRSPGHNVLTVASSHLHSIRQFPPLSASPDWEWDMTPWPVNFDDFNPPTPYSAYAGTWQCDPRWGINCNVVKPENGSRDGYYPYMIMPPQIRDLDPNWKTCHFDKYAAFDPPVALHTRPNMFSSANAQPTSIIDEKPMHTPPTPGQSGGDGVPIATARATNAPPLDSDDNAIGMKPTRSYRPSDVKPLLTATARPGEQANNPRPVITVGPSVLPIDPSGDLIIKPGLTLTQGAPPLTIDGTKVSIGPSGIILAGPQGTSTFSVPGAAPDGRHFITVGTSLLPIHASGGLVIRPGNTMRNGDPPHIVAGTTVSIGPSGILLTDVQGTKTVLLPSQSPTDEQLITLGSQVYTLRNNELILGPKMTLAVSGAAATIAGTTVSLASDGVVVIVASRTSVVPVKSKAAAGESEGLETPAPGTGSEMADGNKVTSSTTGSGGRLGVGLLGLGLGFTLAIYAGA